MRTTIITFLLLFFCLNIQADAFARYLYGSITVKKENQWKPIEINDYIEVDEIIKVGENSGIEMEGKDFWLVIQHKGTYTLEALITEQHKELRTGIFDIFYDKINELSANAVEEWEKATGKKLKDYDDGEEERTISYIKYGIEELADQNSYEAQYWFEAGYFYALDSEKPELYYYLGLVNYMKERKLKALRIMSRAMPQKQDYFYNNYFLILGALSLYTKSFEQARDYLIQVSDTYLSTGDKQLLYLMQGFSLLKTGSKTNGEKILNKAIQLDSESYAANCAKRLL